MASKMLETWRQVVAQQDLEGLDSVLSQDAIFHSPIIHTPRHGKAIVKKFITAAFDVFGNGTFRYVREVVTEPYAVLEFTVEIDGIVVNGVDIITWNEQDQIIDFKVMIRPLKAIHVLQERMMQSMKKASLDKN